LNLYSFPVVVAITALATSGFVSAADQAAVAGPAAIVGAAPGGAGCATCNNAGAADCATCGKSHRSIFHHTKTCKPYQTQLCPGACFGYFQTQWHRWENVCPIPYQGVGLNDAPVRPARPSTTLPIPKSGSDLPVPKALPKIPSLPGK
ncbi:MAG TPA: hypothetical protein VGP33_08955, partial [Chloroflexota bacterium]|nr:hypothetical protein [Chloroflexota bacterium]